VRRLADVGQAAGYAGDQPVVADRSPNGRVGFVGIGRVPPDVTPIALGAGDIQSPLPFLI
jgi:hypothetical protein